MIARPADEWIYKVTLNGVDVSKMAILAVSVCGWGYVRTYRRNLLNSFYIGADGQVVTDKVWGRVKITRRGHR